MNNLRCGADAPMTAAVNFDEFGFSRERLTEADISFWSLTRTAVELLRKR
ncbi:MAG: hypothetical protein QOG23_2236 [Blastocatellia bacterium]|nr:hypothetical protein [Blastocatellia bacterium]